MMDGYDCFPVLSSDGQWLAVLGGSDANLNRVRLWDSQTLRSGVAMAADSSTVSMIHPARVLAAAFSPDGRFLATVQRAAKFSGAASMEVCVRDRALQSIFEHAA